MRIFIITAMLVVCSGCGRQGNKGGGRMPKINLTDSCVAYYKLDDNASSTVVLDAIGEHHGTSVRNTSLMHTEGMIGGGLRFQPDDYVDTNATFNSIFQDSFAINVWYKPDAVPLGSRTDAIWGADTRPLTRIALFVIQTVGFPDHLTFNYQAHIDGSLFINADGNFFTAAKPWAMITCVVQKLTVGTARLLLYVDGVLIDTHEGDAVMADFANERNFLFGAFNDPEEITYHATGVFDSLMVFDKALSAEEVAFLYNGGRGTETLAGELYRTPHSLGSPWDNSLAAASNSLGSPAGNNLGSD